MSGVALRKATGVAGAHLSCLCTCKTCSTGESSDRQSHQDGLQPGESAHCDRGRASTHSQRSQPSEDTDGGREQA